MHYRRLGRTGAQVSEIGLGLWGMGGWPDADDRESAASLALAADLGCTFFDSAWAYGNGKSDRLLGDLLASRPPAQLYAATKVPPRNGKWPADPRDRYREVFPRAHVFDYAERSRRALRVATIDLLQFHVWDDSWADDPEFPATVAELKSSGLIRAFGLSLNRWESANGIRAIRTGCVDAVQVIYNIFEQAPEDELLPACRAHDVGVIARVPLDEGSLAGTLTLETRFPANDFRARYFNAENLAATVPRVERLKAFVAPGLALAEMALRFILSNDDISTVIVGMRKERHVRANLAGDESRRLSPELLRELRAHRWDRVPTPWSG
jgi:aryl-alcohol dehydrogenase-like predicted oxidoreductase